jgi:Zn-dependent protease/CBS domain-containing protein
MKWSWKIAQLWGIDVYVHATFLLIVGWVAYSYWLEFHALNAVLGGIVFLLALFACVVLHEYGHALMARRFGVKTRDITLYPIGGVARLERIPEKPVEELWVAVAGPAVNVLIAIVLGLYLLATGGLASITALSVTSGTFLARLLAVNVLLVAFNILPAFPMDGGRVLRALLAMRMDHLRATQVAATVGQGMAFLFGVLGLFGNPTLLFIAFFVWLGAEQEANMARIKHSLGGIPVSRAMMTDYRVLSTKDTLANAVALVLSGSQHDFPVVDDGHVVGMLDRDALIRALAEAGQNESVVNVMRRDVPQVDTHEMVESALARLEEGRLKTLPVTHAGELTGLITSENITELLMIRSALGGRSGGKRPGEVGFAGRGA